MHDLANALRDTACSVPRAQAALDFGGDDNDDNDNDDDTAAGKAVAAAAAAPTGDGNVGSSASLISEAISLCAYRVSILGHGGAVGGTRNVERGHWWAGTACLAVGFRFGGWVYCGRYSRSILNQPGYDPPTRSRRATGADKEALEASTDRNDRAVIFCDMGRAYRLVEDVPHALEAFKSSIVTGMSAGVCVCDDLGADTTRVPPDFKGIPAGLDTRIAADWPTAPRRFD